METIPTYVQQEIRKCIVAIREAQRRLNDPRTPRLQTYNLRRRIKAQRNRMQLLEKKPVRTA